MATSRNPFCSKRLMISPTRPRCTPSGLMAMKVRSRFAMVLRNPRRSQGPASARTQPRRGRGPSRGGHVDTRPATLLPRFRDTWLPGRFRPAPAGAAARMQCLKAGGGKVLGTRIRPSRCCEGPRARGDRSSDPRRSGTGWRRRVHPVLPGNCGPAVAVLQNRNLSDHRTRETAEEEERGRGAGRPHPGGPAAQPGDARPAERGRPPCPRPASGRPRLASDYRGF